MSDRARWSSWSRWASGLDWRAGDHFTVIGPTGSGKSFLAQRLLQRRAWAVVLATKPRDRQLVELVRTGGFLRIDRWPPPQDAQRVAIWPKLEKREDQALQSQVLGDALDAVFSEGAWTVLVDEVHYAVDSLGLGDHLRLIWQQGRALDLSLVAGFQRPAHVPLEAYSQAQHLAIFRATDKRDRQRLAEVGGHVDRAELDRIVVNLPPHAFAHVDTRTGAVTVTRVPAH